MTKSALLLRRSGERRCIYHGIPSLLSVGCTDDSQRRRRIHLSNSQMPRISLVRNESDMMPTTQSTRSMSMLHDFLPSLHFWGGAGVMIKTIHFNGTIPFWAAISILNVSVRTGLFPFVIYSAHNASRFAKVAPEVQFAVTVFQNDLKKRRAEGGSPREQAHLFRQVLELISGLYKLHSVNPLSVFISPLCQIPIFWYFSVDLRKIINGADPALAQQLTEGGLLWFPDLTSPDPWFALPVMSGILLYYNVEVAVGKQNLSGETASKSNIALLLKDGFQSKYMLYMLFIP